MTGPAATDDASDRPPGPRPWDVRWLAETDSTNRVAMDLAAAGAAERVVVVADHQTAGRGRLGRTWAAPSGASLLASILLRPANGPSHLQTVAVALAAADACRDLAGVEVGLKWPNDLVATGPDGVERKLAGILAEADGHGVGGAVVVGIGLNVRWPPLTDLHADLSGIIVALNHLAPDAAVGRRALLNATLEHLDHWLAAAPAQLIDAHRARCRTLGRRVRAQLPPGDVEGTAIDLTPDGALLVDTAGGTVEVRAGDVIHLRPAG